MRTVYIHGATATSLTFAYIQSQLNIEDPVFINYDSRNRFHDNLKDIYNNINGLKDDFQIIAHSLGGIYALHLLHHLPKKFKQAVTLSTPFNGSEVAVYGRMFNPGFSLFRDITPYSKAISESKQIEINIPWTHVITTKGYSPWFVVANDGVVTVSSMDWRTDMKKVSVDCNHYEVVQSKEVCDIISNNIK